MYKVIILTSLLITFIQNTNATQFEIIREHSKVAFDVDYMSMTKVDGIFKDFYGSFNFDETKKELSAVNVDIIAKSLDTNDGKRDFHLRGQEFFLVESNPMVNFKSTGVTPLRADNTFSLRGIIKLRGIEKPFLLEGQYKGKNKDAWGKFSYFFTMKSSLNRKEFKMNWNKALDNGGFLLGDIVDINIALQTQPMSERTAFSTHMIPNTKGIIERDLLKKGKIKKLTTSTDPKDHQEK